MSLASDTTRRRHARAWADRLLVAGALAVLAVVTVGIRPLALGVLAFAVVTGDLVRIDRREHRLPNRLVLPVYPVVLIAVVLDAAVTGMAVVPALVAGAGVFVFLLLLSLAGGMGMGDVKLGGAIGLCLGGFGLPVAAGGLMLAFVLGAIGGVVALSRRDAAGGGGRWSRRIPFGPFLLAGFWLTVLYVGITAGPSA